jgi:hypothetical protein
MGCEHDRFKRACFSTLTTTAAAICCQSMGTGIWKGFWLSTKEFRMRSFGKAVNQFYEKNTTLDSISLLITE